MRPPLNRLNTVAYLLDLLIKLKIRSANGIHVYRWNPDADGGKGCEYVVVNYKI